MMRFYKQQHQFYCGVDLHAKAMHVCLVDQAGKTLVHRNLKTEPELFLAAISPYLQQDLVVGVECMFTWYWLADLYAQHNTSFVLGHALYMFDAVCFTDEGRRDVRFRTTSAVGALSVGQMTCSPNESGYPTCTLEPAPRINVDGR